MSISLLRLPRKPEARTETVEDLVKRVLRGQIRVPSFQRGLRWQSSDVTELFDSLYRGFPVGSLLFYKHQAPASRIQVGPLDLVGEESAEAWWVVDGQQRITSLAASLARPLPQDFEDEVRDSYQIYFDSKHQAFQARPPRGLISSTWVPLPLLRDATQLSEWMFDWQHRRDADLRRTVFEAGARLREFTIPLYLIETDDEEVARKIYYRVNQAGKPLEWGEVHKALFGGSGPQPSTLDELADTLETVGMGRIEEERLLTGLLALRGLDPTLSLDVHVQQRDDVLDGAVAESLPVWRRVLSFLRRGGIPHSRLLPKSIILDILLRFFSLHPDPASRSRQLLERWVWRGIAGASSVSHQTLRRRGVAAIDKKEEESVQRLLGLMRRDSSHTKDLPERFDPRSDDSRLLLLALADLGPRDLLKGSPIDVADRIEKEDKDCFIEIFSAKQAPAASRHPANRLIASKATPLPKILRHRIDLAIADDPVLASHAISPEAVESLRQGDVESFLEARSQTLKGILNSLIDRRTAWDYGDRPSMDHLLAEVVAEA